jgi:hypothetical protein
VKYVDPDGKYLINNIAQGAKSALDYAKDPRNRIYPIPTYFEQKYTDTSYPTVISVRQNNFSPLNSVNIKLGSTTLNSSIDTAIRARDDNNSNTQGEIYARVEKIHNDLYAISVDVKTTTIDQFGESIIQPDTGVVAYARFAELKDHDGNIDYNKVQSIANETINIARNTTANTQNVDGITR